MSPSTLTPLPAEPPRRPPFLVRLFTSPVSAGAVERRLQRTLRPLLPAALTVAPVLFALVLATLGALIWMRRPVPIEPRHRAEALCFALAENPRYTPPMAVEAASAQGSERFPAGTPPAMAMRLAMRYGDEQVTEERRYHVGDYEVAVVWLHLPEGGETRHWLVVGWMEETGLATCSFRFAGGDPVLSDEQRLWGQRLVDRILRTEYFTAGSLPRVHMVVAPRGDTDLRFGPREAD